MSLTRDQILGKVDLQIKELDVPEWGGSVFIRQLTRGEQDTYLKRQYADAHLKQDSRAKQQEISAVNIYGHDAYLCACGICDAEGVQQFKPADVKALETKNGEVIGRIALAIVEFSGMRVDAAVARGEKTDEQALADEIKN